MIPSSLFEARALRLLVVAPACVTSALTAPNAFAQALEKANVSIAVDELSFLKPECSTITP